MALACTRSEFITNGNCFTNKTFDDHEQLAIIVYRWALLVDGIIGTPTYAVSPYTTLWSAANDATCGMTNDQLKAAYIGVLNTAAPASISTNIAGSTTALTAATAATAIACLKRYSNTQLYKMFVWLHCYFFGLLGW